MTMPLAEHVATDGLYFQHVNPQWVKLLRVLELSVSYERCEGGELFTADGRLILDFLSGYCVHNVGHNHPADCRPSSISCKSAAPLCCRAMFQNWPANSRNFTLGDILHTVHGSFNLKRGAIRFDPATNRIRGEILVEAASGNSGSSDRDKRMQNEVLESVRYPDVTFRPDRVEGQFSDMGASTV